MTEPTRTPAVVLFSGGLDSTTCLAQARADGYDCYALSFDYGQRHTAELAAAQSYVADHEWIAEHKCVRLDFDGIGGSALTDPDIAVPETPANDIPATYVPARNTVFLSVALGWAEVLGAQAIYIGVNAVDYSGYPDCRPEFIEAFERLARLATKAAVQDGNFVSVQTPLIDLSKADIIRKGLSLGVDYARTVSCYQADMLGRACGRCDACRLRRAGFEQAGVTDPTIYQS
ncbi:7-cyano-7-deazaguanine synthase protein [Salinisphaera shabanensis E1L3A]|uniref:7-cyano-7-deazaguanine synthase n=1 Tax=Salinisphaera shabanensis E1L3A TaxID=1033802 RepID=F7QBJ1_9GAMM|nr:7-cyano-7-deazaguanine synthase QueC [Salinisphaera shabanensis]ERJ18490.1 7-cyano-7-deazaguanine synthase protein [Salinisphaera shabanensis E1L3A]